MLRSSLVVVVFLTSISGCRCGTDPGWDGGMAGGADAGGAGGGAAGGGVAGGGVAGGGVAGGGVAGGGVAGGGVAGGGVAGGGVAGGGVAGGGVAGGGVAGGGTAGGGTAGGGMVVDAGECTGASSCPGADTACQVRTCIGNACGFANADAGLLLSAQTTGDCRTAVCDGDGGVMHVVQDLDLPTDDNNPCTRETCTAGTPAHPPAMLNSLCPGGVCNATSQCVECNSASQCTGADSECSVRTCVAGACGRAATDAGIALLVQTPGDCKRTQCDGDGGTVVVTFDSDLPADDGAQCTTEQCMNGTPLHAPLPVDTACSQTGGTVCDAFGSCVACNRPAQCGTDTECKSYTCAMNACGVQSATGGTPLMAQTSGDCHTATCEGDGGTTTVINDLDVPADEPNACTSEACSNGSPQHNPRPVDTTCGGGVCSDAGTCVQCNASPQCGVSNDCVSRTCTSNACVITYAGAGVPTSTQTANDCLENQCDGDGGVVVANLDSDVPADDSLQCTQEVCSMGVGSHPPATVGTTCSQSGGTACSASGTCVVQPTVVSTSPANLAQPVATVSAAGFSVTFSAAMSPASLSLQGAEGACTGSVQVSLDNFATCIAGTGPTMTSGNTVATFVTTPGMMLRRTYRIRVTGAALSAAGGPLVPFTMADGFALQSPAACEGSMVISQVYGGGGSATATFSSDFIELHNRGFSPVSLAGLSLQYASAGGAFQASGVMVLPAATVPAGGYFLVVASTGLGLAAVPPADFTNPTQVAMSATAGKVALVNGTTAIASCTAANVLDLVGYGSGVSCSETAATPAPSNVTALFRGRAGCDDQGDNSRELTTATPAPRNSAATAYACACQVMNESNNGLEADFCNVQFPPSLSGAPGSLSVAVYGRIYESSQTPVGDGGADPLIRAQLGFGPPASNPQYQGGWVFTDATFNVQVVNDDEYQAQLTLPAAGSYRYGYRFSLDQGVSWTYCDPNGAGANVNPELFFEVSSLPVLTSGP